MLDLQSTIFNWASLQPLTIGLTLGCVGLLLALQGFRFARVLLSLICAGGGFVCGDVVGGGGEVGALVGAGGAAVFGLTALLRVRIGLVIASMFTFGALTPWLCFRLGLPSDIAGFLMVVGGAIGASMFWLCRRKLPLIITTLQGAGMLVVAFVAVTSAVMPTLGETFTNWANSVPLTVPVLMVMLCVTGVSVQSNAQQGDMETGAGSGWNRELIA